MHIIPAVDIKSGKTVRLFKGERGQETIYSNSPVDMAKRWADAGATYLHVVDLDGAFDGVSENESHLEAIVKAVKIPVQAGGGIRSLEKAQRLVAYGIERVIIGTRALESHSFIDELVAALPGKVNVSVDARDGLVAVKGWTETSKVPDHVFLRSLSGSGVATVIYTDISRDGTLQGPNVDAVWRATVATDVPIIASGGVSSVEDIKALAALPLFGIIIGKALYEGEIDLAEALAVVD